MNRIVMGEKLVSNRYIIGSTAITFIILMMMPNYSLLAYTDHGDGVKSSSDTIFFRVLKGDLNVCSPNYQYNITVCQVVMKDEELSPYAGKATKNTYTNNTTNSDNYTNRSNYPPLSANPEIVINEEQLQALLANSTLSTVEDLGVRQNDTGASVSNDTQDNDIRKIYVDGYPQYDPLVIEQPLEGEIVNDNSLQAQWQNYYQQPLMNNQTSSSEVHDIEESIPSEGATRQDGSSPDNNIDNPKADTSNSYSSIPIGISFPHKN